MKKETQETILELVKTHYNEIAFDFSQTRKKMFWPELFKISQDVQIGDRLLDAACGSGRLLDDFQDKNIEYFGVDNSIELITCAKKNYPGKNFQVDDLLLLDKVENNYFDWVFCIAALHHLPGEDLRLQALKKLAEKMKPNGRLIISVWRPIKNKKFLRAKRLNFLRKIFFLSNLDFGDAIFHWGDQKKYPKITQRYYHAFSASELKKIIKKANLEIIDFKSDSHNYFVYLKK